jgi:adenylyltransferase/sulfurtransferase
MVSEATLERYSRQMRFAGVGEAGQRKLAASRVTLCGCGALGTVIANSLVRAGVGALRIVDRDFVELNNLQRQVLFDEADAMASLPKALAATEKLRQVNSQVAVEPVITDLDHTNVERWCGDADVILDGTDNFETRLLMNDYAFKTNKPWVYGGCIGSQGQCLTIVPGTTACLRCLVEAAPLPGTAPTCETAGILAPISTIIASFQVAEALKLLTGNVAAINRDLVVIDVWDTTVRTIRLVSLEERRDCPVCAHGRYEWLDGGKGSHTTRLCGRNAVQVVPETRAPLDLAALARSLGDAGSVSLNSYLVRLHVAEYELTIFADGRAIIKGTEDVATARSLYARYVGH